jgi:hypothetical protein
MQLAQALHLDSLLAHSVRAAAQLLIQPNWTDGVLHPLDTAFFKALQLLPAGGGGAGSNGGGRNNYGFTQSMLPGAPQPEKTPSWGPVLELGRLSAAVHRLHGGLREAILKHLPDHEAILRQARSQGSQGPEGDPQALVALVLHTTKVALHSMSVAYQAAIIEGLPPQAAASPWLSLQGNFLEHTWDATNFQAVLNPLASPAFHCGGNVWRLVLDPRRGERHAQLALELCGASSRGGSEAKDHQRVLAASRLTLINHTHADKSWYFPAELREFAVSVAATGNGSAGHGPVLKGHSIGGQGRRVVNLLRRELCNPERGFLASGALRFRVELLW